MSPKIQEPRLGGEPRRAETLIQQRNRKIILRAALDEFSAHGFHGASIANIARAAGLSKANLLYYFSRKEELYRALLTSLIDTWGVPLTSIDPDGDPREELVSYVRRKLQQTRTMPRESRLLANEILQGGPHLEGETLESLRRIVQSKMDLIRSWCAEGRIPPVDAPHLLISVWALTQNYADYDAQIRRLLGEEADTSDTPQTFLETLYGRLLTA
ncbi:TetR family transcriptional regulator C-terminal domain-containing protein [Tropicimonas sp. IMCC34011]|uniref:TetR family transcriptional regulator C-terminal domain-containing protein n=1 Tax=Tropicimonas sp. IMCC34011 TaxID=2248759 RepID=UPI000E25801A|nr:TetR family transcriptional regulator C-terminal domain-containing protein [Tropicimonas sp. IMCC34011]